MGAQKYPEPTVGALIFNPQGELLLLHSSKWRDKYVVPGGHVELGETLETALRREVREETGLDIFDIQFLCWQEFIYDDAFWKPRHFLFFDFTCKTDSTRVELDAEAQAYVWVPLEQALKMPLDTYTTRAIRKYMGTGYSA